MAKQTFTFKKQRLETGLAAVGNSYPTTTIKHQKMEVGAIYPPNWRTEDNLWRVRLMVGTEENWTWKEFKRKFETEPEARQFLKDNAEQIIALGLFHIDPD